MTDGQFSFTLSAVSAPDGVELAADQVASCADGGTASFGELTFSSAGTYVFQVSENEVDPALAPNVSHDDTTYTLTYVVEEGADRNLHVTSTAVAPSVADDEHHIPQTGDTLGGVRLAVVLVAAAGVAFVALGLEGARRRMRR